MVPNHCQKLSRRPLGTNFKLESKPNDRGSEKFIRRLWPEKIPLNWKQHWWIYHCHSHPWYHMKGWVMEIIYIAWKFNDMLGNGRYLLYHINCNYMTRRGTLCWWKNLSGGSNYKLQIKDFFLWQCSPLIRNLTIPDSCRQMSSLMFWMSWQVARGQRS